MPAIYAKLKVQLLEGFSDPALDPAQWGRLLDASHPNTVFQTWHYQNAWWESFGRGRLMLLLAKRGADPVLLAPLFWDCGMVFLVGSGGSDYLGLVGRAEDCQALTALLGAAKELSPQFLGFRFYHIPDDSILPNLLRRAAGALGTVLYAEEDLLAPRLVFGSGPDSFEAAASRKSLVRHENRLRRTGRIELHHTHRFDEIRPWLQEFFEQHIGRWAATSCPSLFIDQRQRAFYERLAAAGAEAGWLRFTALLRNGKPVAFHYGFFYAGEFLWYKPSFDYALAAFSPGEVLLRHLIIAAAAERASVFDFGIGDEPFKRRFCNAVRTVRTWGLYPRGGGDGKRTCDQSTS